MRYLHNRLTSADKAFAKGDAETALNALGQAMHALQDFFAHTNFVEELGWGEQEAVVKTLFSQEYNEPPTRLVLAGWDPSKGSIDGGKIDGDNYSHDKLAKDDIYAGKDEEKYKFELAYQAALDATRELANSYRNQLQNTGPCGPGF